MRRGPSSAVCCWTRIASCLRHQHAAGKHGYLAARSLSTQSRGIVFDRTGKPSEVLRGGSLAMPCELAANELSLRVLLAPLNPVDFNVIEGAYVRSSVKQRQRDGSEVFVGGNEGVAVVEGLGAGLRRSGIRIGDWVNFTQHWPKGTWRSHVTANVDDVIRVPRTSSKLTELQAATLAINPATSYRMLSDFVKLQAGDFIMQNAANSAVGRGVIAIARNRGIRTINFVRSRDNFDALKAELLNLGADYVYSYDQLAERASFAAALQNITQGHKLRLALNGVGGSAASNMARWLDHDAFLVTYGAMSREPLCLPSGQHIFKNLSSVGFGIARWYSLHSLEERTVMTQDLVALMEAGALPPPASEVITVPANASSSELDRIAKQVGSAALRGFGRKMLIRFD